MKFIKKASSIYYTGFLSVALTFTASAQNGTSKQFNQPGYYQMALGDLQITALSDGTTPQKLNELLQDGKPGEIKQLMKANFQSDTLECSVNAYLVKTGDKLILIDAGAADAYGPALGRLTSSLEKIGYKPEQIDAVLLTHIHMDHIGGLTKGSELTFPNADVYISKIEADYYLSSVNKEKAPKEMKRFFDGATQKLSPIIKAGKLKTFEFGNEIFPGIMPVASPGHTPGHSFYALESKGQKIVFWGDIMVSDVVQFADPSITSVYDYDRKEAMITRKKALADAAAKGYWVGISHSSFPGIGHISSDGKKFKLIPINYSSNGIGQ
ncbi:MBL fold metallo-hydrolase [Pedobacter sp. L105]|uniref:MBL fold metallo-hydrolase n=1 Tax=Pedobacter sp. L105 TaxID=1641871 RepID=UPI00131DDCCC|nr:MBL fold metallo-hydrolase [Pedobacter sp. L105]